MSEEMNVTNILENNRLADNDNYGMVSLEKLLEGVNTQESDNTKKEE